MVDTMISLFESTATSFLTNGLGSLPDASKCEVVEERNGSYELELEYHISGKRYSELELRRIILVKPNPYSNPQPFRIYEISKPINGLVTVKAEHISYDMTGYPVSPFAASDAASALSGLKDNSVVDDCPFEFSTDMSCTGDFAILKPESMRTLLGGFDESILGLYGGEYEFDVYKTILHASRGTDSGVTVRYGKNMTDLKQEENCSNVYTAVYPFWYSDEWGLIELPEKTVATPGTYDYVRIYPLDLSSEWENSYEWEDEYPSEDEIRELANKYIADNNLGIPSVSLTVSFEQLSQAKEYEALSLLETVHLCDTVRVEFPKLNVSGNSKCVKTTYNVLTGKYDSIELGEAKADLANSIASRNECVDKKLNDRPTKSFMTDAVDKATKLITGGLGGYVVIRSSTGDKHPDEILIMDTNRIDTAKRVWRWNQNGLGYSANGYGGPYTTAITQDGHIVADFVDAGNLNADIIHGGTLTLGGFENNNGTIYVRDSEGKVLVTIDCNGIDGKNISSDKVICEGVSDLADGTQARVLTKIQKGRVELGMDESEVGRISACKGFDQDTRGISICLGVDSDFLSFSSLVDETGKTEHKLVYERANNQLGLGCDFSARGHNIREWNFLTEDGDYGKTITLHFVQVLEMNNNGTVARYGPDAYLTFTGGVLTDIQYYG